jgi:hypothetical protein
LQFGQKATGPFIRFRGRGRLTGGKLFVTFFKALTTPDEVPVAGEPLLTPLGG